MSNTALFTLLGILASALGAYLVAARRFGGKIRTSEAAQLWEEARELRREYKADIARLEDRLKELAEQNRQLYLENSELKRMIEEHEKTIAALRDENAALRKRVEGLENSNG
jgi:predicted RNase H-like nuclease (RuvC/YqgF family)